MPPNRKAWVGLTVSIVIAMAWVMSTQFEIGYQTGYRWVFGFVGGGVAVEGDLGLPPGLFVSRSVGWASWWPEIGAGSLFIPLWLLLALATVFTVWAWRRGRIPVGCCQSCGYNLTGNKSGRCPECGEEM